MRVAFSHPSAVVGPQSSHLADDVGWGSPGHLYGARGGGLILYVISPYKFCMRISHTNSCSYTLQVILHWNMLLCAIYTPSSMRVTLPRRLVGRSVSTRDRARARAGSNPAVCNFQPSEWSVLISD